MTDKFDEWKASGSGKALFVMGARQIGKSFAIRAFGVSRYRVFVEINLLQDDSARRALLEATDAAEFIRRVSIISGIKLVPGETLVFIDEVQEAPDIMTMSKFLVEDARFDWAFSGSMLGTEFKGIRSYPVGYVHEIVMRPLSFEEFCWAIGISSEAMDEIREACILEHPLPEYLHAAMLQNFRTYLVVGGMPEVVQGFLDSAGDLVGIRSMQDELNKQYRRDISKYAAGRSLHVQAIFDQLPLQLEGAKRKFIMSSIDQDARFKKYERDFVWLERAGVALKVDRVSEPKSPLLGTADQSQFKLYQSDTGMLIARYPSMLARAVYLDDKHPNLGGIYENAVAQELAAQGHDLYYYMTKSRGEVDFVVDAPDGSAVALEVKSGAYYHSHAALDNLLAAEGYGARLGIVLSRGNVERDGKVLYLPLYAMFCLPTFLDGDVAAKGFRLEVARV
ncbi:MAG: ATP-binding protein [Coriobacteriaceae bacterium]|nr:ATP-binding protein [Coriobacteriaceae bacterium]